MMTEDQEQRSTQMPWLLTLWPLTMVGSLAAIALVLLAVFIDSDVTRVAIPAIVSAIGTIALAVVTVRLSINERAHQDRLRRADEFARRQEADHQRDIKAVEERAATEREKELEFAEDVRQARRVAALYGLEGSPTDAHNLQKYTVTLVNGSDYPIFEIGLIGARGVPYGAPIRHTEWPPEMRLVGESMYAAVLLPGERYVFRGNWKYRKGFAVSTFREIRATYTWTDDQGRAWQRDGDESPKLLPRPWVWKEFWGDAEYTDEPDTKS